MSTTFNFTSTCTTNDFSSSYLMCLLYTLKCAEEEVERPYTPVTSLAGLNIPPPGCLRLIVKNYSEGKLSSWLARQPVGTKLQVSRPCGSFTLLPVSSSLSHLSLFAAGTGLTPMVSLISWALRSTRSVCTFT